MVDIVVSVAAKVAECLVAPVGRHCGYVIFPDSYVRQLEEEREKLENARRRVQRSIDEARNNMKPIEDDVEKWVTDVETVANKACDVLENDGRAKKTCLYGWLPNPKARYRLGREARTTVQAIQKLIQEGRFERVFYEGAPPGLVVGASSVDSSAGDGGDTITDSRASIFQGIMKALDDEKLKVIGVFGPGGVGKTTLLKEVEKKLREAGRPFRMIVRVEVSQIQDLNNIRNQIADALKLDLKDKQSLQGKADVLSKRLKSKPDEKVLVIFDNLWVKLDLEAIGIPWEDVSSKCKLLLTSRFKDVLEKEMDADRIFHLQGLTDGEASRLFENKVGDKLKGNEELKSIADQVVKKLAGLPLLIISVAITLKSSDESAWRNALIEIDDSNQEKIETIVRLSYDRLKSEDAKYLFLLCGLIGGTIRVELVFVLAMGLGLFERFNKTIQASRDRLNNMLNELHSACLLLDGGNNKNNVTIHDLYSEVVVSDAFSGQDSLMINNNYGSWPKQKLEKCWACLVNVGSDRLAELMLRQFPHMKILMLLEQNDMGDCSRMDFTYMEELRVLYLRSMCITSLPSSMEILGNLRSLSINCHVEDVANLGKLKALRILSFAWSTISRLPKEIGKLTNLRSLNLSHCYLLKIIEPGALKDLINLEELHMKKSFNNWMGKHEILSKSCGARLVELKNLTKLASLEISIPHPIILLEDGDLPFDNLHKFWINIGSFWGSEKEGLTTMKLGLEGCDSILSRKWVKKNLQKTQFLHLKYLSEFKESPCELCTQGFREVKYLNIKDSPSIKYIADSSNGLPLIAFGKLESFFLDNLINLEKICHGPIAPECFNKLKTVRVRWCDQLKNLWCLSDVQRLAQLEEIEVWNCNSMQSIVTHDAGEDIVSTNNRVLLPNVHRLKLYKLPNMTSFCDTSIQVSLPRLKYLAMVGLLGLEKILYSELSFNYGNLRELIIRESKSTSTSILKLDWILKLPNLKSMFLGSSPFAEVVFDLEDLKFIGAIEILSRLTKLTLDQLPNLQRMWKHDVKLQGISTLRNLRDLDVDGTGLSFLFSVSVAKCLREIREIKVRNCPNMKAVIVDEGRNEGIYDIIEFPLLERLSIRQCPMEKFFSYTCGKKELVTTTSDSQDANSDSFFDQKVIFPNTTSLEINGLRCKELWNNQIPTDSFQKLKSLKLQNCNNLQRVAPSHMWKKLQCCLEKLEVISCHLIQIIYDGDGTNTKNGKLRRLVLCGLENLRCICQSDSLPNIPFPNLRYVEAVRCPRLKMLFPTSTAKFLEQIEGLVVESCEDMEQIAGHEKWKEVTGTAITFFELTYLKLFKLPKFKSFLPEKYSLKFSCSEDFPSLQVLNMVSCGVEPDQVFGDLKDYEI